MQVRPDREAGLPYCPDLHAARCALSDDDVYAREVRVARDVAVAVRYFDHQAVLSEVTDALHVTESCGEHRGAHPCCNVDALVWACDVQDRMPAATGEGAGQKTRGGNDRRCRSQP